MCYVAQNRALENIKLTVVFFRIVFSKRKGQEMSKSKKIRHVLDISGGKESAALSGPIFYGKHSSPWRYF